MAPYRPSPICRTSSACEWYVNVRPEVLWGDGAAGDRHARSADLAGGWHELDADYEARHAGQHVLRVGRVRVVRRRHRVVQPLAREVGVLEAGHVESLVAVED